MSAPVSQVPQSQSSSLGEQILTEAQSGRPIIQDFCPLAESLEWNLGQEYLRDRGNKAFLSDASPVPFVVNNDGTLSRHAAEVFFTSLKASEESGELSETEDIYVLELGIGVGLFARYFLDTLQQLCQQQQKNYYDRLCYIAADRSERMLLDLCRHGVLANHPGRYRVRLIDAMKPEEILPRDVAFREHQGRPLRAVFLNYLLDCLPAMVLRLENDEIRQLHVRTCVARNVRLEDYTDLTAEQLALRAKSNDVQAQRDLLEVYGLFASEYDYRPVQPNNIPLGSFVIDLARRNSKRFLHSYGAIQCLEKLLTLLHDDGIILLNDYGSNSLTESHEFEHQRFSLATFVGVNFAELKCYFHKTKKLAWSTPGGNPSVHSRLLGHRQNIATHGCFQRLFGPVQQEYLQEPIQLARQWLQVGRFELAASEYREAIKRQPYNWVLINEVAMFLIFQYRDIKKGIDMVRVALQQNPTCSAELWNTLGDGLFEWGRYAEARSAYHKALSVNEADVRARYNLTWVYTKEKNYPAALEMIAAGLSLDKMGQYRDRFLQKQQEVVALLSHRQQQEYLLLVNLVSQHAPASGETKTDSDKQS